MKEKTITYGTHSPFDSDSCLGWAHYCITNNHNPDIPITLAEGVNILTIKPTQPPTNDNNRTPLQ